MCVKQELQLTKQMWEEDFSLGVTVICFSGEILSPRTEATVQSTKQHTV